MLHTIRAVCAALAAACCFVAVPARAAESFDNCKGFIDALPATISTQGVWCLRKDLSTAMTSGAAITVATNNVTIDCNGYRVGGMAAGPATDAKGILADNFNNITVRGCNVRGFNAGIWVDGGKALIEDNRLDDNTVTGISVSQSSNNDTFIVRRNLIRDTGGRPGAEFAYGIRAYGQARVLDNEIQGVSPSGNATGRGTAYGILSQARPMLLRNRISGLVPAGDGWAFGAEAFWGLVAENVVIVAPGTRGDPVYGHDMCERNVFKGFANVPQKCPEPSNLIQP